MKNIILLGPPGAGKGTQADLICSLCNIPKISTGDMLREAVASGSDFGKKVSNILDTGGLVSDEIIGSLIEDRLTKPDCKNGSLFDGVPRTLGQASELQSMGIQFTHVIEIHVDDEVMNDHMEESEYTEEWLAMTDEEKRDYLDKDLDEHMSKRPKNESTDTTELEEGLKKRRSFLSSIHL